MASAKECKMSVALETHLNFLQHITTTFLHPDVVLWSDPTKHVILLELTVLGEKNLDEAYERKLAKHEGHISQCRESEWKGKCLPIEVGCRGFASHSLARALSTLSIGGKKKTTAIHKTTSTAEKASTWL